VEDRAVLVDGDADARPRWEAVGQPRQRAVELAEQVALRPLGPRHLARHQAEVGLVDLDLPPAPERHIGQRVDPAAHRAAPSVAPDLGRGGRPRPLERRGRPGHVVDEGRGVAPRARLDVARALLHAAGVLPAELAARRGRQRRREAVSVAGQVRDHVADRPPRQAARPPGDRVGQAAQGPQQPLVGLCGPLEVGVEHAAQCATEAGAPSRPPATSGSREASKQRR
jgi:hypothetical protein